MPAVGPLADELFASITFTIVLNSYQDRFRDHESGTITVAVYRNQLEIWRWMSGPGP